MFLATKLCIFSTQQFQKQEVLTTFHPPGLHSASPNTRLDLVGSVHQYLFPYQTDCGGLCPPPRSRLSIRCARSGRAFLRRLPRLWCNCRDFFKYSSLCCSQAITLVLCFAAQSSREFRHLNLLQGTPGDWPIAFMVSYGNMFNNNANSLVLGVR
jgi:hypothetical protein